MVIDNDVIFYKDASMKLAEAIRFEHWVRFHCMRENEESEDVYIHMPEALLQQCQQEVPHLALLYFALQDSLITLDSTRAFVFAFMQHALAIDADAFTGCIEKITLDKDFLRYLDVFYGFVQAEADAEEEVIKVMEIEMSEEEVMQFIENAPIPSFLTWTQKFYDWANTFDYKMTL